MTLDIHLSFCAIFLITRICQIWELYFVLVSASFTSTACAPGFQMCNDSTGCLAPRDICDGLSTCDDRSDEIGCGR